MNGFFVYWDLIIICHDNGDGYLGSRALGKAHESNAKLGWFVASIEVDWNT